MELQPQQWTGRRRQRVEDARLLTGLGRFVGDVAPSGRLQLAVLRSPHPAAAIRSIDTQAARALTGVVAVFTGADVAALGQAAINPLVPGLKPLPFALLAQGAVQAVASPWSPSWPTRRDRTGRRGADRRGLRARRRRRLPRMRPGLPRPGAAANRTPPSRAPTTSSTWTSPYERVAATPMEPRLWPPPASTRRRAA